MLWHWFKDWIIHSRKVCFIFTTGLPIYREGTSYNWHYVRTNETCVLVTFQILSSRQALFIHYLGQPGQCRDIHSFQRWHVRAAPYPTLGKSILACSHISPSFIVYEAGIKKPVSKVLRLGSNLAMDQVLPKCLCFEGYF